MNAFCVASFSGDGCMGNAHIVMVLNAKLKHRLENDRLFFWCSDISLRLSPYICVFLSVRQNQSVADVRFFHGGRQILRCGSGSLAAASVLIDRLSFSSTTTLFSSCEKIQVGSDRALKGKAVFYYQTSMLPYRPGINKRAWSSVIDRPIKNVTLVGGGSDYCIIELFDEPALRNCRVHACLLTAFSKRALIVTATSTRFKYDYAMRYFIPQYGKYEDAATGSANALLACYWQHRYRKNSVRGRQLSSEGGRFEVRRRGLQQRVIGEASVRELPENLTTVVNEGMEMLYELGHD